MTSGTASLSRDIHGKPGIGLTAHVVQGSELRVASVHLEHNTLIFVDQGIKTVVTGAGATVDAAPGQAIVLRDHQTVDFRNALTPLGRYEARWLIFDPALLLDGAYQRDSEAARRRAKGRDAPALAIARIGAPFQASFEAARAALAPANGVPDAIARLRMLEVAYWLLEQGVALTPQAVPPSTTAQVRHLVSREVQARWSSAEISGHLAMSEATLRRRLLAEGTSLTEVVANVRMASALTLLQATSLPVAEVALSVGYESPSRFAVRFRKRFGFSPSAVRGSERAASHA